MRRKSIMPLSRAISIKYLFDLIKLGRPNSYGMMIHESGAFFAREFSDGKANGKGHLVLKDSSYYHG